MGLPSKITTETQWPVGNVNMRLGTLAGSLTSRILTMANGWESARAAASGGHAWCEGLMETPRIQLCLKPRLREFLYTKIEPDQMVLRAAKNFCSFTVGVKRPRCQYSMGKKDEKNRR